MTNKLEALYYVWNTTCESLCFEKLTVAKKRISNEEKEILTNYYSKGLKICVEILRIIQRLLEMNQKGLSEDVFFKQQLEELAKLKEKFHTLNNNEEFSALRAKSKQNTTHNF